MGDQKQSKLLSGKTAVITGCNRGIGKAILESFSSNGADVWACVREPSNEFDRDIMAISSSTGSKITPVYFDLSDINQVKEAARKITKEAKQIDVLVNNAGSIYTALFQMTSMAKMQEMFDINYFSQVAFTQYIVKSMTSNGGSIINLSSSAAFEGNEGRLAYASAKSSVITFTKVLSRELGRYGIRVNAIAPGLTQTDMMEQSTSSDALQETLERITMGRVGDPDEIANVALFLGSELSSYMTGQVMRVDGGM